MTTTRPINDERPALATFTVTDAAPYNLGGETAATYQVREHEIEVRYAGGQRDYLRIDGVDVQRLIGGGADEVARWHRVRKGVEVPRVGDLCTYSIGSDDYAGKVVAVRRNGREVDVEIGGLGVRAVSRRKGYESWMQVGRRESGLYTMGIAIDRRDPDF